MEWFRKRPHSTRDFLAQTETYNEKYGEYDYTKDARTVDNLFESTLLAAVGNIANANVVVAGSNSGYEIASLSGHYPTASFTAVDIADKALEKISKNLPSVAVQHADMEHLPFQDKEFDMYLNCRAIHSSNVDMEAALEEAIRVTRGRIIISVANGYLVKGQIVKGMYDYEKKEIDPQRSRQTAQALKILFEQKGFKVSESESNAELFLTADKK